MAQNKFHVKSREEDKMEGEVRAATLQQKEHDGLSVWSLHVPLLGLCKIVSSAINQQKSYFRGISATCD